MGKMTEGSRTKEEEDAQRSLLFPKLLEIETITPHQNVNAYFGDPDRSEVSSPVKISNQEEDGITRENSPLHQVQCIDRTKGKYSEDAYYETKENSQGPASPTLFVTCNDDKVVVEQIPTIEFTFKMPSQLSGVFVGIKGKNIIQLQEATGANVSLAPNPFIMGSKICKVVGDQHQVKTALQTIRRKFPLKKNPLFSMVEIDYMQILTPSDTFEPNSKPNHENGVSDDANNAELPTNVKFAFDMPIDLCGRLVGKNGAFIKTIKIKTGATVSLQNNPLTNIHTCHLKGNRAEVNKALEMIRTKFPLKKYPDMTMAKINPLKEPKSADSDINTLSDTKQQSIQEDVTMEENYCWQQQRNGGLSNELVTPKAKGDNDENNCNAIEHQSILSYDVLESNPTDKLCSIIKTKEAAKEKNEQKAKDVSLVFYPNDEINSDVNDIQADGKYITFSFLIPSIICKHLVGYKGKNVNDIIDTTGAKVYLSKLKKNIADLEFQTCYVIGHQTEVDNALAMIREKFPLKTYPTMTMEQVSDQPEMTPCDPEPYIVSEDMWLTIKEGSTKEVYVSAVAEGGRIFLVQPNHPSLKSLWKLNNTINETYNQSSDIPSLPAQIQSGTICVFGKCGGWYRTMVVTPVDDCGYCYIRYLDYGGYVLVNVKDLKQIREDFMEHPFPAFECVLVNVSTLEGEEFYSDTFRSMLIEMTLGKVLQCQVVARSKDDIPCVRLYTVDSETGQREVHLNRALAKLGFVRWFDHE